MWFRSLHDPTKGSENNGKNTYAGVNSIPNASSIPLGYCVRFHSGNTCYLLRKYNHNCYACNRSHPANKCWNLHAGGVTLPSVGGAYSPSSQFVNRHSFRGQSNAYRQPSGIPRANKTSTIQPFSMPNFRFRAPNSNTLRYFS